MKLFIGIDTGTETGLAVWNGSSFTEVRTTKIHAALKRVEELAEENPGEVCVVIEDANLRKWFPQEKSESEYRGKLMGAGSVKRDSTIWRDFCKDLGIQFTAVPPRPGMTKWNEDYWKHVTGWTGRTSEHARDAALLVFGRK